MSTSRALLLGGELRKIFIWRASRARARHGEADSSTAGASRPELTKAVERARTTGSLGRAAAHLLATRRTEFLLPARPAEEQLDLVRRVRDTHAQVAEQSLIPAAENVGQASGSLLTLEFGIAYMSSSLIGAKRSALHRSRQDSMEG